MLTTPSARGTSLNYLARRLNTNEGNWLYFLVLLGFTYLATNRYLGRSWQGHGADDPGIRFCPRG